MSSELRSELLNFHLFLGEKIASGEITISPEQALDEWRVAHQSEEEFEADVAAVREALEDMAAGDTGIELAEFDREFRERHGVLAEY
jgi:hypothetical protein